MNKPRTRNVTELDRREEVVPKGSIMCSLTVAIPVEMRVWLEDKARAREISIGWVAAEMMWRGIENTKLEE